MKSLLLISIVAVAGSTASELYARHAYSDGVYSGQFLRRSDERLLHALSRRADRSGGERSGSPNRPGSSEDPSSSHGGGSKKGSSGIDYYPGGFSAVPFDQVDFSKGGIHISKVGPMPDWKKPLPGPTAEHRVSPDRGRGAPGSPTQGKASAAFGRSNTMAPGGMGALPGSPGGSPKSRKGGR